MTSAAYEDEPGPTVSVEAGGPATDGHIPAASARPESQPTMYPHAPASHPPGPWAPSSPLAGTGTWGTPVAHGIPTPPQRYRAKDCPHFVPFGDLRSRYRITEALRPAVSVLYLVGTMQYLAPLISLALDEPDAGGWFAAAVITLILMPFNLVGVREAHRSSKRLHRPSVVALVVSLLGHAVILLFSVQSVVYGMPLAAVCALATLYQAVDLVAATATLPRRAACRSLPAVIPAMRKRVATPPALG